MSRFILSGFSDEIAPEFDIQLKSMQEMNIAHIEIRGVDGKNVSELTHDEARAVKKQLDTMNMSVSCIGSPIGKIDITDPFEPHLAVFRHLTELAEILEVKFIRIFSFYMAEGSYDQYEDEVFRRLRILLSVAKERGLVLLHENEKGIYGDIPERCKKLLDHMNDVNFKLIFDPANFVQCGVKTYPEAFETLKDGIKYVHIKDAIEATGQVVPSGYGDGHVPEIIHALNKMNYEGFLSIEPHLGYFEGFDNLENDEVKVVFESKSGADKFALATGALRKILQEVDHG